MAQEGITRGGSSSLIFQEGSRHIWTIWAALALYITVVSVTVAISYVWYLGGIQAGISLYLLLATSQFIGVALIGIAAWRIRRVFTLLARAVLLSSVVALSWWSIAQPLFTTLVIFFDRLQLTMLAFAWLLLVPVWGTVMTGLFTFAVFRPFLYLKDPQKIYRYSIQYPRIISIGFFVLVLVAYFVGPSMIRIFTNHPDLEFYKFLALGMTTVLFVCLAFFFAHDTVVRPIRRQAQKNMVQPPPVRQVYAWRVFISSILISFGVLLFIGMVVLRLYQASVAEHVQQLLVERIMQTQSDQVVGEADQIDYEELLKLSDHTTVMRNPSQAALVAYSPEVATAFAEGEVVALNRQIEQSIIGIVPGSGNREPVLIEVPVRDFYTLAQVGVPLYVLAAGLVFVFSVAISGYFSFTLAHTLRMLSSAVRRARDTVEPFRFSTYTGDELEELSRAFQYYITQANELRAHLEEKVKQRTAALLKVEEEKRALEVTTAQQQAKFEHQKRELAEDVAKGLEEKVRERTAALRDAIRHLQELDRVKSEFISLASHQLRTPLTSLRWAQHALLEDSKDKLTVEQKKIVEATLNRTLYMMGLVNELLDVTRIEDQKYELKRSLTPMHDLLDEILQELIIAINHKKLELTIDIPKSLPGIMIDSNKVKMAVSNILDNAVKYTPAGGKVLVRARQEDMQVVIQISDTGIGVPKEDAYRTFSKFFRATNATKMHTSGSGLGLYIAKTIIERHGGNIAMESDVGKGTTVTMTIPIVQEETEDQEVKKPPANKELGAIDSLVEPGEEQS